MTGNDHIKELGDGEWTEVLTSTLESKSWKPVQKEGSVLFLQTEYGKFAKYVFENGRYNLVGEVSNG